jgi:hypothetical protein
MRFLAICAMTLATLGATTLERLSMDQMIAQSTYIVRARVQGGAGVLSNRTIYTKYSLQVTEQLKGSSAQTLQVLVPGGSANGLSQSVAGSPKLIPNSEMVLFLWQSPKGLIHVIGMQQGAFDIQKDATGTQFITRNAISEATILDKTTLIPQSDTGFRMSLSELRSKIGAGR